MERPDRTLTRGFGGDTLNTAIYFARLGVPTVYATALGDEEGALKMLESTLPRCGAFQVMIAETDTDFDGLRDDRRFQKIIADAKKRLGIKEPVPATSAAPLSES